MEVLRGAWARNSNGVVRAIEARNLQAKSAASVVMGRIVCRMFVIFGTSLNVASGTDVSPGISGWHHVKFIRDSS